VFLRLVSRRKTTWMKVRPSVSSRDTFNKPYSDTIMADDVKALE
jgi:hypothetical protein